MLAFNPADNGEKIMLKKINTLVLSMTSILIYSYLPAISAEKDLTANAAEYICTKAREGKKTRLAVYTFTNDAGVTSSETKGHSTKIMSLIIEKKEFKVIDPDSVPAVINEQEKGLTGLVDAETAAETGKMIGADALVFGISGKDSMQVRIVDAATGEVIGATLEQSGGKTKVKNEDFNSPEAKKKYIGAEFERSLRQSYEKHPLLFLFLTANPEELAEMNELFPDAMNKFQNRMKDKDPDKNLKFEKRKKRLLDFRNENPGFNKRIIQSRKNLLEQFKNKKDKRKKK